MIDLHQIDPRVSDVRPAAQRFGSPTLLDWLIALAGVWILTGLFIDAHQHLFMAVESFINPWHLTLYSGAVFAAIVLCVTIARNYRAAGSFRKAIPFGYLQSVIGVAALLVGGALDALWHSIFGFEHQLDLLLSPPHLFLLTGLFFLITGPVRSGLARPEGKNFAPTTADVGGIGPRLRNTPVHDAIRLLSRSAHARSPIIADPIS